MSYLQVSAEVKPGVSCQDRNYYIGFHVSMSKFIVHFKVINSSVSARRHSRRDCDILVPMLKAISSTYVEANNFRSKQAMARWSIYQVNISNPTAL